MLSSVLRSEQAAPVNIYDMERAYDTQFKAVFEALRRLMKPPGSPKKRPIGYIIHENDDC